MGVRSRGLWVDLCYVPNAHGLVALAQRSCDTVRVAPAESIFRAIQSHRPQFVCVEYDYPDTKRLRILTQIVCKYPALPLLMLTEFHSEALAIWAFRSGVWDYRVKPITADTLARLLAGLAEASWKRDLSGQVHDPFPRDLIAPSGHLRRPLTAAQRTAAAAAYIIEHYAEPVPIGYVAELCHLSESGFSRAFHREHGVSFRRFLLLYRIAKARDFLAEPHASVSEIAFAVGFNDLSFFGRMFRRIVGVPATRYQKNGWSSQQAPGPGVAGTPCAEAFQPDAASVRTGRSTFH